MAKKNIKKINRKIVINKINNILAYLKELQPILKLSPDYIKNEKNYKELRTLERNFQLIVDTMIEINSHFISKLNLRVPDDYTNTFIILGENKILPYNFTNKIAKVVGLRNKIVHKYDVVDMEKFISDLKKNNYQFGDYAKHINNYLKKNA